MVSYWTMIISVFLSLSASAQEIHIAGIELSNFLSRAENAAEVTVHYGDEQTQILVESWPWGSSYVDGLNNPFVNGAASLNDVIARLQMGEIVSSHCEKIYGVGTLFTSVRDNFLHCTLEFRSYTLELLAIEQIFGVDRYTVRPGPLPAALYFRGF